MGTTATSVRAATAAGCAALIVSSLSACGTDEAASASGQPHDADTRSAPHSPTRDPKPAVPTNGVWTLRQLVPQVQQSMPATFIGMPVNRDDGVYRGAPQNSNPQDWGSGRWSEYIDYTDGRPDGPALTALKQYTAGGDVYYGLGVTYESSLDEVDVTFKLVDASLDAARIAALFVDWDQTWTRDPSWPAATSETIDGVEVLVSHSEGLDGPFSWYYFGIGNVMVDLAVDDTEKAQAHKLISTIIAVLQPATDAED